jgi:hypothetical protein
MIQHSHKGHVLPDVKRESKAGTGANDWAYEDQDVGNDLAVK